MKPRILFLNRSYWPDTEATGQLLTDLTEDLADRFDVHVLAGRPNHLNDRDYVHADEQLRHGVTIHRTRHSQFSKASKVGKLINLMSFTASAYWRLRRRLTPDVVVAQTDPFFLPLVAGRMRSRSGCRMIVTLQDIYPDVMVGAGLLNEGAATRTIRGMLQRAYRQADRIVVLSRDMREKCRSWGLPDEKLAVIPNWADTSQVQPDKQRNAFRAEHGLEDAFVVMYSGNLGYAHLLEPFLRAAERLKSRPEIQFVIIGEGVQKPRLEELARVRGLNNVRFLPYQPRDALSQSLSAADVHFVSMHPNVADCLMPSKLYGILASGTAIIAACPSDSELGDIIRDFELGVVCDAGRRQQLVDSERIVTRVADAIESLASRPEQAKEMGEAARLVAVQKFDRRIHTQQFGDLIEGVLGTAPMHDPELEVNLPEADEALHQPHGFRPQRAEPAPSDPFLGVSG